MYPNQQKFTLNLVWNLAAIETKLKLPPKNIISGLFCLNGSEKIYGYHFQLNDVNNIQNSFSV